MSEPIIIETPQPPVAPPPKRECLILVDEGDIVSRNDEWGTQSLHVSPDAAVDFAEPADLERAGWVRDSDLLALTVRAEAAEAERDEARDTIARARGCITDVPAGVRNALDIEVARLLRERDEARAEAAKLDAKLAQAEERGDLADQRAIDAIAERDEVRRQRDAEIASRDALARVLEQVERERVEVRCLYEAAHCERMRITDVLQRVERERDEARAALAKWQGSAEQERARCVAWLRSEAASSDWASCATWGRALSDTADRLERGEHADTPVPAAEPTRDMPRATDEELVGLFDAAASRRAAVAAVAARVRREQCLVTRAVEAWALFSMRPYGGGWVIMVSHGANHHRETVPAADVPATLARLLGEVAR